MKLTRNPTKLLGRMLRILLPGCAIPILVFGYLAISSHFESMMDNHIESSERLLAFMVGEFDAMTSELQTLLFYTSQDPVLKSENESAIGASLKGWRAANPMLKKITVLDDEGRILRTEPSSPAAYGKLMTLEGSNDVGSWHTLDDGTEISPIKTSSAQTYRHIYVRRKVTGIDGKPTGYLVVMVDLSPWLKRTTEIVSQMPDVIGVVIPDSFSASAIQVSQERPLWWERVAKLRGETNLDGPLDLLGEDYYVLQRRIPGLNARMVLAQPLTSIYQSPRRVIMGSLAAIAGAFFLLAVLIFFTVRSLVDPIATVAEAAEAFSGGNMDIRIPVDREDEIGVLAHSFNSMADSNKQSQFRSRALYESIRELFSCEDANAILKKAVELSCTQSHGTVAWFIPNDVAGSQNSRNKSGRLSAWIWRQKQIYESSIREANAAWERQVDDRVYVFVLRNHSGELGILRIAYAKQPSQMVESILHSLITLVGSALEKQEQILNNALASNELEISEAVQRNMLSDRMLRSKQARIAYHYQPATRLRGDWFYLIEDTERDSLWVLMGDVAGHGMSQGLITTAVRGALDGVDWLIKKGDTSLKGPADVLAMLDQVVSRALGESKLAMACVALKIDFRLSQLTCCNAGHTFPIHIHHQDGVSWARHLQNDQQPILGTAPVSGHRYHDAHYTLKPGDLLVAYTDGLADAKSLDSKVFGRLLFRNLRQRRDFVEADKLKSDILEMFQYYTQGAAIDADVCFLIVQMNPYNMASGYKGVS